MRRLSLGAVALLLPLKLAGQTPPATEFTPIRVGWQLVDFVLLRSDSHYVRILASPNLRSAVGGRSPMLHLSFDRIHVLQWATIARQAIQAVDTMPQADSLVILTPLLPGNDGRAYIILSRASRRENKDSFVLSVKDSGSAGWNAVARTGEIEDLVKAMLAAATAPVHFPDPPVVDDSNVVMEAYGLDRPPTVRTLPTMRYPRGERGSGRVWVQYVIDTKGRVEMNQFRTLLSDGAGYTQEVRRILSRMEFDPGVIRRAAVRVRVFQVFNFVRD